MNPKGEGSQQPTPDDTKNSGTPKRGSKIFATEQEAREYLEANIPPKDQDKKVDLSALKERLFEIPENLTTGHYEFEGRNGLHLSFDLSDDSRYGFDRCYQIFGRLFDHDNTGDGLVTGEMRTIFKIENLRITTENFSYDSNVNSRRIDITWLPNLHATNSELSPSFVFIEKGELYLTAEKGWLSRPVDLLGFFHELGHVETRSIDDLQAEHNSINTIYSIEGVKTEPLKATALEFRREQDANSWMQEKIRKLFNDLGIPPELIEDYIQVQLQSYHEANRFRLAKHTEGVK